MRCELAIEDIHVTYNDAS